MTIALPSIHSFKIRDIMRVIIFYLDRTSADDIPGNRMLYKDGHFDDTFNVIYFLKVTTHFCRVID